VEIDQAVTFKEIIFALFSNTDLVEWSLIKARVTQWKDPAWTEFIELAMQNRKNWDPEQKKAFLNSFRRIIGLFETQQWFTI